MHFRKVEAFTSAVFATFAVLALIAAFVLLAPRGYGFNLNNYGMLRSWQEMAANGIYIPSRAQGNVPSELALGYLAALGGPLAANALSFGCSLAALILAYLLFRRVETNPIRSIAAVATIAINPYWVLSSTTAMDYVHPFPFILAGILLLITRRWPILAAILFAVAGATRLNFSPFGFFALLIALKQTRDGRERQVLLQALFVFLVMCGLFYFSVYVYSHLRLSFLSSAHPPWQGWAALFARWGYKGIYLYGFWGALIVLTSLGFVWIRRSRLPAQSDEQRLFSGLCVAAIVYELLLFLYLPVRIEYLLPILFALAGLLLVRQLPLVFFVMLIIAQGSYWFSSLDLLEVIHKSEEPCAGVEATGARIRPHLAPGVLNDSFAGTAYELELACMSPILLERPASIRDPLPVPPTTPRPPVFDSYTKLP